MKSIGFAYERPESVADALRIKSTWGGSARFLAGGQSLMPAMNLRFNQSECLIDLNRIDALRAIRVEGDRLVIGAMARHAEVLRSALVARHAPLLLEAGRHLAHTAIRNRGTFGGSVALADPAAEWPAACLLLDAEMHVDGPDGRRVYSAGEFFQGYYATALGENDLLSAIAIPFQSQTEKCCVLELARRQGDFAVAAVMARAERQAGKIQSLRLVYFGVSDQAVMLPAMNDLVMKAVHDGRLDDAEADIKQALDAIHFRSDLYHSVDAKRHLCAVLTQRAAQSLISS